MTATGSRSLAPMVALARREAGRTPRQTMLGVVAVAVPVGFAAFIGPAFITPSPISVMFVAVLAAVISLSVGAVIAASTKRRVVRYARLAAIGADPGQIRALLLFESAPAAATGWLFGFVVGTWISIRWGPVGVVIEDASTSDNAIVGLSAAVLAVSTAAGLWLAVRPAAAMALDSSVIESLAARAPEPEPRPHQGRIGLLLVVVVVALATVMTDFFSLALMVALVFFGLHLMMPPMLLWLERHSGRLPRTLRLAVRNGARNRTRLGRLTLASTAAVALGVMGAAGIQSDLPSNPASGYSWGMDQRFILIDSEAANTEQLVRQTVEIETVAEIWLIDANVVRVIHRDANGASFTRIELALHTPELDAILGLDTETSTALADGKIVAADGVDRPISVDGGTTDLATHSARLGFGAVNAVGPPGRWPNDVFGTAAPLALISAERADQLELTAGGAATRKLLLLVAASPLTDDQVELLDRANSPVLVSAGSDEGADRVVAAIAAAFLIVFGLIGAALSGHETEHEVQSMIANGADPSIRRWFRAVQSGLQLGLAALIGAPLGVVMFWAVTRTDPSVPDPIVPWEVIISLGIGVPLVVTALVAATTAGGTPAVSRRAMV